MRSRLTLSYLAVVALVLGGVCLGTFFVVYRQLRNQLGQFVMLELETFQGLFFFVPEGTVRLPDEKLYESNNTGGAYVAVLSPDGKFLFQSKNLRRRALGEPPAAGEGVGGYYVRSTRLPGGEHVRLVSRSHLLDGRRILIRVARSEEPIRAQARGLFMSMLVSVPALLVVAGIAGYALVRRALSPIEHMTHRARDISAQSLSQRFPNDEASDELSRLARALNDTLARIESAFEQLRRFTSDCSHELRAPLAMIRSVGEGGLQKTRTPEEYRNCIGSMLEEVDRLTSLVDRLLLISRADTGNLPLQRIAVRVMAVAREAASRFEVLIEEKSLRLVLDGDERVEVEADRLILKEAFVNIIHNAVKYSPNGETVVVRVLNQDASQVTVEVEDSGPGIPPEDQIKLFERFYRGSRAREGNPSGAGLGLAIAKWAVEANGGSIKLVSSNSRGSTFRLTLPRKGRSHRALVDSESDSTGHS
jgi:heavy metal sensor kinase